VLLLEWFSGVGWCSCRHLPDQLGINRQRPGQFRAANHAPLLLLNTTRAGVPQRPHRLASLPLRHQAIPMAVDHLAAAAAGPLAPVLSDEPAAVAEQHMLIAHQHAHPLTDQGLGILLVNAGAERMVRRLRRPLVLADAAAEEEFRHDPRVMAAGLRSVLCLPQTLQSQVLGVVYLENNLASNVFGSLRLETIEILGTQLAISLENASLYGVMARINCSYGRFIPHEFLSFLGRDSILDVELGDQVLKRMTVLFADIREFTAISERLTPKESFDFLNGYLRRVGPIVRLHNGFIDKYIGDAVMALFPGSGADAVRAALAIQREVAAYNQERGAMDAEPLRIGIGIHTGDLMLGTVGEEERMESTVISDAVNLADRVEDLTKTFGCSIALTADTLEELPASMVVTVRSLGDLQVRGKSLPVKVLELIDADGGDSGDSGGAVAGKAAQLARLERFETGVEAFHAGRLAAAAAAFAAVLRQDPDDTEAAEFLRRCRQG